MGNFLYHFISLCKLPHANHSYFLKFKFVKQHVGFQCCTRKDNASCGTVTYVSSANVPTKREFSRLLVL